MKRFILLFISILLLFVGCKNVETMTKENPTDSTNVIVIDSNSDIIITEERETIPVGMVKSPLTGLYIAEEELNNRPIAVMLDNLYKARPQAGLSEADIVYEVLAEGNITRYLAIIHSGKPEKIGPVRSARPYFLSLALEYDPLYVHVGGSTQALADIKALKMADIDGLSSGKNVFWRENHKPMPNNMYTSLEAIKKEANRKGYSTTATLEGFDFNDYETDINGDNISTIKFPYRKGYYESSFKYDKGEKLFYRYVNEEPHLDEITKIHLSAKNIIVQFTKIKVIDSEGRLEISLIGEGKGYYLTNGKITPITWKKENRRSKTLIYDQNGEKVKLNPGVTWFQIVPENIDLSFD